MGTKTECRYCGSMIEPSVVADEFDEAARAKRIAHANGRFCADPRCDCTALDLRPEPVRPVSAAVGARAVACLGSLLALTCTDSWNGSFALDDALEEAREILAVAWTVTEAPHTDAKVDL
jgi:hypothetical protein